jgi:ATP-dependent DNA helicase DinG
LCEEAQIIVANHALYLTDIVNEIGLLPKHDVVVFDEAHHLEQAAVRALSVQINHWMFNKFMQRVQSRFKNLPSDLFAGLTMADMDVTHYLFTRGRGQFRMEPDEPFCECALAVSEKLRDLACWIEQLDAAQMSLTVEGTPEQVKSRAEVMRDQMRAVAEDLAHRWRHFAELSHNGEQANWMTIDPTREAYELQSAPLDVGHRLNEVLWEKRTSVLCSATLAVDNRFDFIRGELGLPVNTHDLVLGSPFDFKKQALLYVPTQLPEPADPTFMDTAADEIERILEMSQGRALVLCTSYRSLRELHGRLLTRLQYPIRTQEDLPRARLIEWFRTTEGAVLFATATFWEGVDIPGEALSCVIIDKLPFASPGDPITAARIDLIRARGGDPFGEYQVPLAILALQQGLGRLIRHRQDRGVLAVLDPRLRTMGYGRRFVASLPPAPVVHELAAVAAFFSR